jgi:glutaredoxin
VQHAFTEGYRILTIMCFHRKAIQYHTVIACLLLIGACKKSAPLTVTSQEKMPPQEVRTDSALFFTYVESNGMFATTDKAEAVPEIARRFVRIMSQTKGEPLRRNDTNVEVVDLRELLSNGKTLPRVMPREAFETSALAQLPPGDSCLLTGPHPLPLAEELENSGSPDEPSIVTLYATRWCKACMAARQYLMSNRIPYTVKDIEKDPTAAHELEQKALRFGLLADRVPILDVRGRLMIGYDESRMNGQLADW